MTIKQVAREIGRTEWWTRTYFKDVAGALVMLGLGKRGRRRYDTITVPVEVFERELKRFRNN